MRLSCTARTATPSRFIAEGADLVAFSGGKLVRGPAASGFLAGRRRLIRAATIQHRDAFVHPDVYQPPFAELGANRSTEPPHQGLGRVLKVGREEIAGLMVALQAFVRRDHAAEQRGWEKMSETIAADLRTLNAKGVSVATPTAPWVHVVIAFPDRSRRTDGIGTAERPPSCFRGRTPPLQCRASRPILWNRSYARDSSKIAERL
jgi:seryl-tRNA(Sec) selenium transferase